MEELNTSLCLQRCQCAAGPWGRCSASLGSVLQGTRVRGHVLGLRLQERASLMIHLLFVFAASFSIHWKIMPTHMYMRRFLYATNP